MQTKEIIFKYLNTNQIETAKGIGIEIDSDWLLLWLIDNVMNSDKLTKFYNLLKPNFSMGSSEYMCHEDVGQEHQMSDRIYNEAPQSGANPASIAKYLVHLSHLILYALHQMCQKEMHERILKINPDSNKKEIKINATTNLNISSKEYNNQTLRFAFGDTPDDLGITRSDSQLNILASYAYYHWGVHRELKIYERLSEQLHYELPLYAANQFYRDHIYHVMDVCLLGELLLTSRMKKIKNFLPEIKSTKPLSFAEIILYLQNNSDSEALIRNWYVASLFHDFGYVIENVVNLITPVDDFKNKGFADFVKTIKDGIALAKEKLKNELDMHIGKFSENCKDANLNGNINTTKNSTDHGVAAWLHLINWCNEVEPVDDYNSAFHAIIYHNQKGPQLDITKHPLTFLLFLCDHLQEWGRPLIGPEPLSQTIVESLRYSEKVELHKHVRVWRLKILGLSMQNNIGANKGGSNDNIISSISCMLNHTGLKFILSYEDNLKADFEPIFTWLLFSNELQGFNCPKSIKFIPITIEFHHKKFNSPENGWYPSEMELFQEFCNKEEKATYLLEFILKAREGKGPIKYIYEHNMIRKNSFTEIFRLDLPMNGRPLDRGINIELLGMFKEWKEKRLGRNIMGLGPGPWRTGKL